MNPSQKKSTARLALLTKAANDPRNGTLAKTALQGLVRAQQAVVNMQQGAANNSTSPDQSL